MTQIKLLWDKGTAYDFFISMVVIHDPAKYGLRGSWAAGVRSRLPGNERELLQRFINISWPLNWVYTLPEPKDAKAALRVLDDMPASQRLPTLAFGGYCPHEWEEQLKDVAVRGTWTQEDINELVSLHGHNKKHIQRKKMEKKASEMLAIWADASAIEEGLLSAFRTYYENFYAEEEDRINSALDSALADAQKLSKKLPLSELMQNLSQGVLIEEWEDLEQIILVPSFWSTPFMLFLPFDQNTEIRTFGARPSTESLVPGEVVPDALYQALKSLADPTRLKILHYLSNETLSPAELARRLRLRPPTVLHHLDSLRLARLVQMTLSQDGKRYSARHEAINETCAMLLHFIAK